ncbi:acyltransferase [Pedobacter cryoconitis]|uniref:Acetyltransferase-like isoleucine patch superfamily enzyme n=1 Tax=Pedobacter cryoconitis TaxID=188932 RepID=A0A327SWW2_9SPHI|nr:acyltransferase [Pedobacter cryoconitis]RAJ33459.1 acetyltransferase-like isoleucine patch superfamily enzyme [Pedobacter cryoconitis]
MIVRFIDFFKNVFYYKWIFRSIKSRSVLRSILKIEGAKNIDIGNHVIIGYKGWLAAVPHTGSMICELIIGDGCRIGNFNHIYATKSIIIEKYVLTADKVYISDNLHGYENINIPILQQVIQQKNTVIIGEGAWLGENVCILGASVGKNSVIGANSVVTRNIPDYCVAVGSPAKIIKRFCFNSNKWKSTDQEGNIRTD